MRRLISVLMENEPGSLSRVIGLFLSGATILIL